MRLAPYSDDISNPAAGDRTLDEILGANAARSPEAPALVAPGCTAAGGWRRVDGAVSSLAETFAGWRLGEDAVVGVQLGSTPEAALTCLALWRAGLVPAMLPLAWRRREAGAALACVGATAIVTMAKGGGAPLGEIACEVAAGLETIRFVGCFGGPAPDGATALDEALDGWSETYVRPDRPDDAADHVAIVTFEAGGAPVARSHNELAAAALGPVLAMRLAQGSRIVSTLDLAGLAGLSTGLVPWLLSGGRAVFHTASTSAALDAAVRTAGATHLVAPGRLAADLFADLGSAGPAAVAVWRAPDGSGMARDIPGAAMIVDVVAFGEVGIHAAVRPARERHAALTLGQSGGGAGVSPLIDIKLNAQGELGVRGPACPQAPCPADPSAPSLVFDPEGFVETGLGATVDGVTRRFSFSGLRRGVAQVGGLALSLAEIEAAYRRTGLKGEPALADDRLFGARLTLAGAVADEAAKAAETLEAAGFGPAVAPIEGHAERALKRA